MIRLVPSSSGFEFQSPLSISNEDLEHVERRDGEFRGLPFVKRDLRYFCTAPLLHLLQSRQRGTRIPILLRFDPVEFLIRVFGR